MRRAVLVLPLALLLAGCGRQLHVTLDVTPDRSLLDAPLRVHVAGLPPYSRVRLRAVNRAANGVLWHASGVFVSDRRGRVDPDRQPSLGGTYRGRGARGLLWSMRPPDDRHGSIPVTGRVTIEVLRGDRVLAQRRIERLAVAPQVRAEPVRPAATGISGTLYTRPGPEPRPAALMLGGARGGLAVAPDAAALASHGYPTLALSYFNEPGLPPSLDRIPLEYFARGVRWLAAQPGVDPRRIVIVGDSMGAEAALFAAAAFSHLVHGVVAFVPSVLASRRSLHLPGSAWSLRGRPIPPGTMAPVGRIRGPVLAFSAQDDATWDSSESTRLILQARPGLPTVRLDFPAAGHPLGYMLPDIAHSCPHDRCPAGGTAAGNAAARGAAWAALLGFLARG